MLNSRKPGARLVVVASLSAGLLISQAVPAMADDPGDAGADRCFPNLICEWADGGTRTPGPGSTQPGGGGGGGGGGVPVCSYHNVEWPCHDPERGWFDSGDGCYYRVLDTQPSPSDRVWDGHTNADGSVYTVICLGENGGYQDPAVRFVDAAKAPKVVSPEDVARDLVYHKIHFPDPVPGLAPKETAVVNSPVWLWVENSGTPAPKTASAGASSVTVTPRLAKVTWDFDGQKVECDGVGTPYDPKYGASKSPDCPTEFKTGSGARKNGVFAASVRTSWVADVVVSGPGARKFTIGGLYRDSGAFTFRVAEVQVLN
ncbi:hypothetical protein [Streptomyces sp. NRRL WC-3742]|uniref:hypothetical protein n=1 Tax=Streptomyces sp. NRRL WC-3742 TaxID=1463934 RepID=UPI00131EBCAC|nr:hypothetical protein [Streptomyces sp. NRRL WC-3742]